MTNYLERAEKALWQAENVIGATPEAQARLFLKAQVYATFHLADVITQAQLTETDDSEPADANCEVDHERFAVYGFVDKEVFAGQARFCPKCGVEL